MRRQIWLRKRVECAGVCFIGGAALAMTAMDVPGCEPSYLAASRSKSLASLNCYFGRCMPMVDSLRLACGLW